MRVLIFKLLIFCFLSLFISCRCEECLISADIKIKINCDTCATIRMKYKIIDTTSIFVDTVFSDPILFKNQSNLFEKNINLGNRFDGHNVYLKLYLNDSLILLSNIKTSKLFCSTGKRKSCGTNFGFEITELLVNGERKEGNHVNFEL